MLKHTSEGSKKQIAYTIKQFEDWCGENIQYTKENILEFLEEYIQQKEIDSKTVNYKISHFFIYLREKKIPVEIDTENKKRLRKLAQQLKLAKKKKELGENEDKWYPEGSNKIEKQAYTNLEEIRKVAWELQNEEDRLHLLTRCFTSSRFETLQKVFCPQLYLCEVDGIKGLQIFSEESKTNPYERKDSIGYIQHKDPYLCAVGSLARVFVKRWRFERPPRNHKPFEIDGAKHRKALNAVHKKLGIILTNSTHASRHFASNWMEAKKVPSDQIRKQGLWAGKDVVTKHYYTTLPTDAIKALADVNCKEELPRTLVQPEFDLIKRHCFYWIEPKDEFFQFLGAVYLQDSVILGATPEMENDPEYIKFREKCKSVEMESDRNLIERKRIREEAYQQALQDILSKRKKVLKTYNPAQGMYMDRSLVTLSQVVEEYLYGLGPREPIRKLNQERGSSWRNTNREMVYYSARRKPIYEFVEKLLQKYNYSYEKTFLHCQDLSQKYTISQFIDLLKSGTYDLIN